MNETRACKTCGAEFQPLAPGRKYCGSKCRPSGYSPQQQKGGATGLASLTALARFPASSPSYIAGSRMVISTPPTVVAWPVFWEFLGRR